MEESYNYIKEEVQKYSHPSVVVAVSGGPDSMALLHLLVRLQKEINLHVICAHVHHNIRKESDAEKVFVEAYCKENGITFEWMKIDFYGKENFHKEARSIRYTFFDQILKKYKASFLLTAHHGDDLMETILMRLVRGSTLKGYSGFPRKIEKEGYQMLRPFLLVTKEDILKYNEHNKIKYVLDASNEKDKYTRNRYRKYILPVLKKENPKVHQKFYKYSETLLETARYIDQVAYKKIDSIYRNDKLCISKFIEEDPVIQKRILHFILEKIYGEETYLLTDAHTDSLLKMIYSKENNQSISLPKKVIGVRAYDVLSFQKEEEFISYHIEITKKTELPTGNYIEILSECRDTDNFVCKLSKEDVKLPLYVRTHQKGDKMAVKGLSGHKKISTIFMEKKLSLSQRKKYPIVVDRSGKIIWVPGLKKSQFDRSKEEKYDIILKYYVLKGENNE